MTVQELKDWSEENGEDVIFDGPYMYNMTQYNTLTNNFINALVDRYGESARINEIEDIFNWGIDGNVKPRGVNEDEVYNILLQCFADLINSENLQPSW